jgi:ribosomal protein L11 methyltransferase
VLYPALDIRNADSELVLAAVDDFAPTAVEETADGVTVYFPTPCEREAARVAVAAVLPGISVTPRDVDDEDWARRSQQNLTPVTVGLITVAPPWATGDLLDSPTMSRASGLPGSPGPVTVVIEPSMGFGTGHHATTRLCLEALQRLDLAGCRLLDVGTGSGVLAIAASIRRAGDVLGVDVDPDAIRNAVENLQLNPAAGRVRLLVADFRDAELAGADVVIANLTGAVLVQNAERLMSLVLDRGTLIISGLQAAERDEVVAVFAPAVVEWTADEAGWVALMFTRRPRSIIDL